MSAVETGASILQLDPPQELQQRLLKQADSLAMIPAVAMQALDATKDPECPISKFSSIVERDVKLASDILSMANSAMYAPPRPIASLHQAVVRLGFRQCKNLILTSSIAGLMQRVSLKQQWVRELLWQHSFTTALMGLNLNRVLHLGFQGEEFTAGLIHDLGRTLLAVLEPGLFAEFDPLDFVESFEIIEREQTIVGTDHCSLGGWFVQWSGLPDVLVDVVRYHHATELAGENEKLVALTALADHMANYLQHHGTYVGYDPTTNEAIERLVTLCGPTVMQKFMEQAPQLLESVSKDTAEMIPPLR